MQLLKMSVSGALMILAITAVRAVAINRLPKKTFLILWEISIARLLLPFSVPSVCSVYSLASRNAPIHETIAETPAAALLLPSAAPDVPHMELPAAAPTQEPHTGSVLLAAYCIVALLLAVCFTVSYLRCRMEFCTSLPVSNSFAREWLHAHPLRRHMEIRQSDRICAPLTYGIFHPVILMPQSTDWRNETQLRYVLTHEYIHIRRWDALAKLVSTAALCIHWFNPFVWVMYLLFNRDVELSCDECLVRRFGVESRSSYARTLISMEEAKSSLLPLYNSFSKNAIEERITAIMKTKKLTVTAALISVTVLTAIVLVFATSARADTPAGENILAGEDIPGSDCAMVSMQETLTSYLTALGELQRDLRAADGSPLEWDMEAAKELSIDETTCYAFDLRYAGNASNGMAGRLVGSYAVSKDCSRFYRYNAADDLWEAYETVTRLETSPRYDAGEYPICGIIRGIADDTMTVEIIEFIAPDNTERIEELGLTEDDMISGYYLNTEQARRVTWQLNDQTSYTFIDWGGEFNPDQTPGYCVTMDRTVFETYLSGYPSFEEMKMPFFFRVEDGAITGIFDYPFA